MNSRPIKLALVTRRFPPLIGGAEKVLSYLAWALVEEGAKVTVITSRLPGSKFADQVSATVEPIQNREPIKRIPPGQLSVVRLPTSKLRFWGTWRYMRNLKWWFRQNSVDLAYVSMLKHDAYVVLRAGERLHFPVVLRPEGAGATGDLAWQSWGNFGRSIGIACRQANAFVSISKAIEQELQESWRSGTMRPSGSTEISRQTSKMPRIVSIPNGVPIPELSWQSRPGWRAAPRAVFIGRLAPEKALDILIAAWPTVRFRFPEAQLILIGEGPERAALLDQAQRLGLTLGPGQAVDLTGSVADSSDSLRRADLFVLPSREEGMSIALLEAMALGIPLIASSVPGNQRLVNDGEHGRLVPPNDPNFLAHAILDQWHDHDQAILMGLAARSRVSREFSIQAVARQHLTLFHELIKHH